MAARLEAMGKEKYAGTTKKVNGLAVWTGKINLADDALAIPLKRAKPTTWFVNSMSDLFHEGVPFDYVDRVFAVMALCPQHTFQILTKRPERMAEYFNSPIIHPRKAWPDWPLPNVWLGTSVEDQQRADERIPHLLRCPAAVRFLSTEPLLGEIDIGPYLSDLEGTLGVKMFDGVSWVIVGGESGPGARRFDLNWSDSLRQQCEAAGTAFFMKQLGANVGRTGAEGNWHPWKTKDSHGGEPSEWPETFKWARQFPAVTVLASTTAH